MRGHVQRQHSKCPTEMCETCGKWFASKWLLTSHQKTHDPKCLEQCDECLRYFSHLRAHKRKVHGGQKVVACEECGKNISATYYKLHLREYHGERKEIPCTVCGKVFRNQKNFKVHMGLHLGVKYPCRFCAMQFGILGNRTKHEKARHLQAYLQLKELEVMNKQRPPSDSYEMLIVEEEMDEDVVEEVGEEEEDEGE